MNEGKKKDKSRLKKIMAKLQCPLKISWIWVFLVWFDWTFIDHNYVFIAQEQNNIKNHCNIIHLTYKRNESPYICSLFVIKHPKVRKSMLNEIHAHIFKVLDNE